MDRVPYIWAWTTKSSWHLSEFRMGPQINLKPILVKNVLPPTRHFSANAPSTYTIYIHTFICTYIHTYAHTYIHAHYIHTYVKSLVCRERVSLKTYVHMCVHTNIHTGLRVHNCRAASSCAYVHSAIYVGTVCVVISQQALLVQLWDG